MSKPPRKPLDAGFKRVLKIAGVAIGVGVSSMAYFAYSSSQETQQLEQASRLGDPAARGGASDEVKISEATRAKLTRVQQEEAEEARKRGQAYIPDMILGEPSPVAPGPIAAAPEAPKGPPPNRYANDPYRQDIQTEARRAQLEKIEQGLALQMQMMANSMKPATSQVVALRYDPEQMRLARQERELAGNALAQNGATAEAGAAGDTGKELVGGDEIFAAVITTPIDTDRSRMVLASVVGGQLAGAQLRGQIVPMNMSGDIEDVGIKFTSMRFNGRHYSIDAIALNEQTANDALDGSVDRRVFSRYVMPILMAGLSGASTYFTAQGTPATKVATGVSSGSDAVVVDQERASREDARNQGIGAAIEKGVQSGEQRVDQLASRPNRVELPANTPIGVMFNKSVLESGTVVR